MSLITKFIALLRSEPAASFVTALGTVVALIVAFGHLTSTQAGYLSAIATGIGAIITAVLARPVNVAVISGAAGAILQALVLFNLHLSSGEVAAVVGGVNLILGYIVMRPALTPVVTLKAQRAAPAPAAAGSRL
jgi:hypothetical protein